jgi:sugar fermentation stimulation protein A
LDLGGDLVEGRFVARLNRFLALVSVDGEEHGVHVANSGRMRELFTPNARVWVKPVPGGHRKTRFDLALVEADGVRVSADARLPNALVAEAAASGALPQFAEYPDITREATLGDSRLDLLFQGPPGRCYVEVKSVTLVEQGVGLFPDSPTLRGVKHLKSLIGAVQAGHRAAVIFVVQRPDAAAAAINEPADPLLGETFKKAVSSGVESYAYNCSVTQREVRLDRRIPITPYPWAAS